MTRASAPFRSVEEPSIPAAFDTVRYLWRIPLLLLHALVIMPLALLAFLPGIRRLPAGGGETLASRVQRLWSRLFLRIFGIRLAVSGRLPNEASMVVANHISWLDILMLFSIHPVCFVSKAEVRGWPLIGPLATLLGTVYIERGNEASRKRVTRRIGARLRCGYTVAVFPEGGIKPGVGVGRFYSPLFAAALRAGVPVTPVALRYARDGDVGGEILLAEQPLVVNVLRLLKQPPLRGEIMIGAPLSSMGRSRDELTREARRIVVGFYGAEKP